MSISASAAESPSTTVGGSVPMTCRTGVVDGSPATRTRARNIASVTSPKDPSPIRTTATGRSASVIRRATSPTEVPGPTTSGARTISSSTTL